MLLSWRRFSILITVIIALSACTTTADSDRSEATHTGLGADGLMAMLVAESADVTVTERRYEPYEGISADQSVVCLNGHEAIVYEFVSEADRLSQVGEHGPEQSQFDDLMWGKSGWWADSNVLVRLHVDEGRPTAEISLLDSILGRRVATYGHSLGPSPEVFPTSLDCP